MKPIFETKTVIQYYIKGIEDKQLSRYSVNDIVDEWVVTKGTSIQEALVMNGTVILAATTNFLKKN